MKKRIDQDVLRRVRGGAGEPPPPPAPIPGPVVHFVKPNLNGGVAVMRIFTGDSGIFVVEKFKKGIIHQHVIKGKGKGLTKNKKLKF